MSGIYCGNNARHSSLRSEEKKIGTRYTCLKRGFGIGFHLPYDPEFARRFVPIDKRKIYCGNSEVLPEGYDLFGNNPRCFQVGIGAGKASRAKKQRKGKRKKSKMGMRSRSRRKSRRKKRSRSRRKKSKRKSRSKRRKRSR